jgi:hypothetical protein
MGCLQGCVCLAFVVETMYFTSLKSKGEQADLSELINRSFIAGRVQTYKKCRLFKVSKL